MDEEEIKNLLTRPVPARFHQTMEGAVFFHSRATHRGRAPGSSQDLGHDKRGGNKQRKEDKPDA